MYCPQCSTEASPGVQYCRVCGANLKVIGKAIALSEAIGRSDRGPVPRLKEMVKNLKVDHVTEEVSRALEHMNHEIMKASIEAKAKHSHQWGLLRKKTPAERRDRHLTKGIVSLFSGTGFTIFLYYLTGAMVLKLPPHIIEQIPFEIDPVVRVLWLIGLIPALSGLGHIVAGLLVRSAPEPVERAVSFPEPEPEVAPLPPATPRSNTPSTTTLGSVTERTTNLLDRVS